MIYIGSVLGEPEQKGSPIYNGITAAQSAAIKLRNSFNSLPAINVVFHVPGRLLSPDWDGLRVERYSRKKQLVLVSVAVPRNIISSDRVTDFIIESLHAANSLAQKRLHNKGVEFPFSEAEVLVNQISDELHHPLENNGSGGA